MADTEEKTIITIDENARTLSCKDKVLIGVESDYEAKRLYFIAPKFIWMDQKIDLSSPDVKIYVKYKNAYSEPYYVECTDKKVDETDTSKITFSWLIGDTATLRKGNVTFSVWFRKGKLETNSQGVTELKNVTNEWHTTTITGEVLAGIDTSTATEEIIQDKTASIYALYERIYSTEKSFTVTAQNAKNDINKYKTDAETAAQAAQVNAQTAAQEANNAKTTALHEISAAKDAALGSISTNVNEAKAAKTEAVAAKTAAETAKTAAVTAKNEAVTAKTAVENMKYYSIEYDANTYTLTITYNNGTTTS
ncbi:MAG: hypothetical protein PUJ51_24865 [Clostridiales bacterium]|nr:hypothetical protein [Clostridiales bacterium]